MWRFHNLQSDLFLLSEKRKENLFRNRIMNSSTFTSTTIISVVIIIIIIIILFLGIPIPFWKNNTCVMDNI